MEQSASKDIWFMIYCTHSEQKIFFWGSVQIKVFFGLMGPPWFLHAKFSLFGGIQDLYDDVVENWFPKERVANSQLKKSSKNRFFNSQSLNRWHSKKFSLPHLLTIDFNVHSFHYLHFGNFLPNFLEEDRFTMSSAEKRPAMISPPPRSGRRRLPPRVPWVPSPNIVSVIFFESPETFFVVRRNVI